MANDKKLKKTISVCLPVFNREDTIARALASVIDQNYLPTEVIVCDFASTDNSAEIIEKWILENKTKIKIIYQQFDYAPQGVDDWNKTIQLASGDLISILEGDDIFPVDYLEKAMEVFQSSPTVGLTIFPSFNGKERKNWSYSGKKSAEEMLGHFTDLQLIAAPSQAVFSRLDNHHRRFLYNDTDYQYAPEMELYFRIMMTGREAFILNNPPVYRQRGNRKRILPLYYMDHFNFLEMLAKRGEVNLFRVLRTFSKLTLTLYARIIVRFVDGSQLGYTSDLASLTIRSLSFLIRLSKVSIIKFKGISAE